MRTLLLTALLALTCLAEEPLKFDTHIAQLKAIDFRQNGRTILSITTNLWSEAVNDTNISLVVAKVYSETKTNVSARYEAPKFFMSCAVLGCTVDHTPPGQWFETTTVTKEKLAEIEGKKIVLESQIIAQSEREFLNQVSTNRVYLNPISSTTYWFGTGGVINSTNIFTR